MFVIYSNKDFQSFLPLLPQFVAFPGLSLPFPQAKIVSSYPIKINLIGCKWQSEDKIPWLIKATPPHPLPFLFFFFLLVRFAAHLCSGASGCLRRRGCVLALFSSYKCASTPPLFTSSLPLPLSLSLSLSRSRRRMGVGWGGQLEHRRLFVWDFFIWFPSSLHTERAHYAIIYFHIQRRDVEGPVGPRSVLSPLLCFILDPFPNRAHPGRKKNPKKEWKVCRKNARLGFPLNSKNFSMHFLHVSKY